jgi:hypothetical protein
VRSARTPRAVPYGRTQKVKTTKDLPPAPKFAEGWQIGKPDVVLSIPKPFDVAGSGAIAYQFFTVPTNFTEDKWIQALEIRPGERSVVHHILVFVKAPGAPRPEAGFVSVLPKMPRMPNRSGEGGASPGGNVSTFNRDHGARHIDHDL